MTAAKFELSVTLPTSNHSLSKMMFFCWGSQYSTKLFLFFFCTVVWKAGPYKRYVVLIYAYASVSKDVIEKMLEEFPFKIS